MSAVIEAIELLLLSSYNLLVLLITINIQIKEHYIVHSQSVPIPRIIWDRRDQYAYAKWIYNKHDTYLHNKLIRRQLLRLSLMGSYNSIFVVDTFQFNVANHNKHT